MALRRLKPFSVTSSSSVLLSTKRHQSSKSEDIDIEAEIAAAQKQDFSKIRDSLLGSRDSAAVYSQPSAGMMQSSGSGFEDPSMANSRFTRLFIESVVDTDPLGGQHRSDYYRDPATGYAPQHAPRNYAVGGAVDAFHPLSSLHYDSQYQLRSDEDHLLQQNAFEAASTRAALLRQAQRDGGLQSGTNRFGSSRFGQQPDGGDENGDNMMDSSSATYNSASVAAQQGQRIFERTNLESHDPTTSGFFESSASPKIPKNHVASWQQHQNHQSRLSWIDAQTTSNMTRQHTIENNRDSELEFFRQLHGERDRERHEESRNENFVGNNRVGYDVDRISARSKGKLPFRGLNNLVPPASSSEAQSELRRNNISPEHATYQEQAASNTNAANPLMGESLTRHLVDTADVRSRNSERELVRDWHQKTGRGRQNPLVSDGGPDARSQQLGKNDERLLRAGQFALRAYVNNDAELRASPYAKRSTALGVDHLLENNFDRRRRADLLAEGKQDPIERTHMHLGQPLKEQIDERVRSRTNNRPQRPIEYFLPYPKPSDMLQLQAHADVEGFPLFAGRMTNVRLNTFEWDLFIRYRAHFAQRRDIALKHGLEPRPNESVAERAARRQALDDICEKTPFDAQRYMILDHGVSIAPVTELRQWFGAYWLPSPSLCGLMLGKTIDAGVHLVDEKRQSMVDAARASSVSSTNNSMNNAMDKVPLDDREHVLSARYLNKLLTIDTFNTKIGRQGIKDQYLGRAPEPEILYRVSGSTLRHFSPEQKAAYEEYIKIETDKHVEKWNGILTGRRFLPNQNCFGRLMKTYNNDVTSLRPYNSSNNNNGESPSEILASAALVHQELDKLAKELGNNNQAGIGQERIITLDQQKYYVVPESTRTESFVDIKTETGATITMLQSEWNALPEEHSPAGKDGSLDVNAHLNTGAPEAFSYNRWNYIETQDTLWENRVASGEEGWTTALHSDGLKKGLPVRARRTFVSSAVNPATNQTDVRYGDFERATIFNYDGQPFYNPDPREVTVIFHNEATPSRVPLSNTQIWQVQWSGQERTQPLRTYKLGGGMRRFVNMQDPKGENEKSQVHFLDKYLTSKQHIELSAKWRYSKSVAEIDKFTTFDINRPHNHRLISGINVRHYIRSGFMHRYTPWEFILTQEAEAPMIDEQLRHHDSTGPSMYFSPNRFWRFKRRAYGYIKNHPNEVRDLFQYVDAITPWEKAKQIRTHWEVREHHPMPAYHRPALGIHRNQAKLLPAHLWESDKKTGKVKVLKDSLKDYKPLHVYPTWTHL